MHESNLNQQNIGAALDAVKERHLRGELVGDQSISLTSALRQRLPDLKELNRDHSASAIASACLLYTSPSPRDRQKSRMPSSA